MARNPVMLTALAVVHWNERRLPEQRADLYNSIITWLSRSREQRPGRATADETVGVLQELALAMQDDKGGRKRQVPNVGGGENRGQDDEGRRERRQGDRRVGGPAPSGSWTRRKWTAGSSWDAARKCVFWHLTFQEFLAAKAIASRLEAQQQTILFADPEKIYLPEWREVILLLAGILHEQGSEKVDGFVEAVLDGLAPNAELAAQARCAGLLGSVLRDLEPVKYQVADRRYQTLLDAVMAHLRPREIPHRADRDPDRGRRRPGTGRRPAARLPAGRLLGSRSRRANS